MPLYEYECDACGQRFELIRKFSDPPVEVCSACGKGPVRRLVSSPAFQFKGSGWYVTDYGRKGTTGTSGTSGGETASGEKPADGKEAAKSGKEGAKSGKDGAASSGDSASKPATPTTKD